MANNNQSSGFIRSRKHTPVLWSVLVSVVIPIVLGLLVMVYRFESFEFEPVHLPLHELSHDVPLAPRVNSRVIQSSDVIGDGELVGAEDFAVVDNDPNSSSFFMYTGCADGWIKGVSIDNNNSSLVAVENWDNTGRRPLGLALALNHHLIVADPFKGLLNVSGKGKVEVLTDEIEGRKFKFIDGVDVAKDDGMIYFSEASYKYSFPDFIWDVLEGKPHGTLMSFDPVTRQTKVLASSLYFANGVQVSLDQQFVIFCETVMRRCKRYVREGERKGTVEIFANDLPGFPDNIRYDGEGHYWIGLSTSGKPYWDIALRYPVIRKAIGIMLRYLGWRPHIEKNAGLVALDLEGNVVAHYYDPNLSLITGGIKLGDHLFFGSLSSSHLLHLNLSRHPAA